MAAVSSSLRLFVGALPWREMEDGLASSCSFFLCALGAGGALGFVGALTLGGEDAVCGVSFFPGASFLA